MLDLILIFINILGIFIRKIVGKLSFRIPKKPYYLVDKNNNVKFLRKLESEMDYKYISLKDMDYKYMIIEDDIFGGIPIFIFTPINHADVCILYSHGNTGDLGMCLAENYEISRNTNCVLVSYDYPGFTRLEHVPIDEDIIYYFSQKIYKFIRYNLNYKPNQIVLYGFSIGTGVSFDLACRTNFPIAGLILQAPILSVVRTLYDVQNTYFLIILIVVIKLNF